MSKEAIKAAVGECLAGMDHREVSPEARRKIEAAIDSAENGPVAVKPLEWIGPDFEGEYRAYSISGSYRILPETERGRWLTEVGGYWPSVDAAKAEAEVHHQKRILSALA